MQSRLAVAFILVGACATAGSGGDDVQTVDARADAARIDATPDIDAPAIDAPAIDAPAIDAPAIDAPAIDAPAIDAAAVDAPIDGPPAIDAPLPIDAPTPIDAACTPTTTQLLTNANFDATPIGTGWTETRIDPGSPLVTAETPGLAAVSAPNRLWLGGIAGDLFSDAEDAAEQSFTIPAGTTTLVLRAQYGVLSAETGTTPYDVGFVDLVSSAGVILETAQSLSNANETTGWVPLTYTFTNPRAGQVVKLRFSSANDFSNISSFFWDSLSLEATVSCP